MIVSAQCMNISRAQEMEPDPDGIMVSIIDPPCVERWEGLPKWDRHGNGGRIWYANFDDYFYDDRENSPLVLIDAGKAAAIVAFLAGWHRRPEPINLHVHCMAGVSRSAAVAYFAHVAYSAKLPEMFGMMTHPNVLVFHRLMEAYHAQR